MVALDPLQFYTDIGRESSSDGAYEQQSSTKHLMSMVQPLLYRPFKCWSVNQWKENVDILEVVAN